MASMGYQEASDIRKSRLSDRIAQRLVEGQSIGSSFSKSLSEGTKANIVGLKQKVDYLNIAKRLSGGSNLAPALLGRLTGRNKDSIRFFAGKGSAKPVSDKATKIDGGLEQSEAIYETLDNIYGFLKDSNEEYLNKKMEEQGKKEELEFEKKKRHEELMKLLGADTNTPTATKITEIPKESKSFLDMLMDALGSPKFWASLVTRVPFLLFLWGLWEAKQHLDNIDYGDKIKKNESKIAQKAFREKQTDFSGLKITQDEAKAILEQPEGPAKKRDIESFGGMERIQAIADGKPDPGGVSPKQKTYEEQRQEVLPEKIEPRPVGDSGKIKAKQADWDRKNSKDYNDDGTKKKAMPVGKQSAPTQAPLSKSDVATPVESAPPTAQLNVATTEKLNNELPSPVEEAVNNVVNNTTVNSQDTSKVAILPMPSVRNQEPTYQDMILYSTRIV